MRIFIAYYYVLHFHQVPGLLVWTVEKKIFFRDPRTVFIKDLVHYQSKDETNQICFSDVEIKVMDLSQCFAKAEINNFPNRFEFVSLPIRFSQMNFG